MPTRALEFYSGIGGLHRALSQSNVDGSIIRAFDWDQSACRVYAANYDVNIIQKVDISTLTADTLASHEADLWLLSPSCQPYTVLNPLAKGTADRRAKSFIHLMEDILPDMVFHNTHPQRLLIENVAGFETSTTRQGLLATLESLGYTVLELLLTPLQFGIPNSRLRYYLLAGMKSLSFAGIFPGHVTKDWVDPRFDQPSEDTSAIAEIRRYLDPAIDGGHTHPHTVPDHVLMKWGRLFDIILPSAKRSCCFTRGYTRMAERSGSVLQMNEELDTTYVFDRFLEAQTRGEQDAVRTLDILQLRYFSPSELLRIFCFQSLSGEKFQQSFRWPNDLSTKTQYRLIGNSVNVRVVTELVNYLFEQ